MKADNTLSNVVFPEPVPPDTNIFNFPLTPASRKPAISGDNDPNFIRFSMVRGVSEHLRIVMVEPQSAKGGIIAFTREPSFNLASTIGLESSILRPNGVTILSIILLTCSSS